jgi:hypothetical protein
VGRLFSSFEEAWAAFLVREEPLEDFFGRFPTEEAFLTVWLAPPAAAAAEEALAVQRLLAGVAGLRATPLHWLHVSLGHGQPDDLDAVRERVGGFGPFEADYGPISCFHEALVLEAHSERFADVAEAVDPTRDLTTFLPHLSIAYVAGAPAATPIRERLAPLRDRPPVRDVVSEIRLCVIPVARDRLLTPWQVAGVVRL